jgi:AcrR family transcriptional regulator
MSRDSCQLCRESRHCQSDTVSPTQVRGCFCTTPWSDFGTVPKRGTQTSFRLPRATREQILRTAMDTASVKGLSGLSVGELAERVGMTKSGLSWQFGAKEQLQLATIDAAITVFDHEVMAPAMWAARGLDRLRALANEWVQYLERNVFPGGCFFAAAAADVDSHPGAVRQHVADTGRSWIDAVMTEVHIARSLGQLHHNTDARQLAFELHAYVLEANWARLLLDDEGAGDRARLAIDAALARSSTTKQSPG